jgi:flagellar M-ring protein FliF
MKPFFVARSADEMKTLEDLVRKAVGYDEGRGDQISVSNVPFAMDYTGGDGVEQENKWLKMFKENQRLLLNILLMILVFVFVVRPFMKKLQELKTQAGPSSETVPALPGAERAADQDLLGYEGARQLTMRQKAIEMIESNPKRASDIIRAWLRDEV